MRRDHQENRMRTLALLSLAAAVLLAASPARAAEVLRIGLLHTRSPAPLDVAMERGYRRDEGVDASFRFFEAAQPIPPRRYRVTSMWGSWRSPEGSLAWPGAAP